MNASPSTPSMYQVIARKYRPQGFDELSAVHVAGSFAGGDEDAQGAYGGGHDSGSFFVDRWQIMIRGAVRIARFAAPGLKPN